jgi:hypothetical protein
MRFRSEAKLLLLLLLLLLRLLVLVPDPPSPTTLDPGLLIPSPTPPIHPTPPRRPERSQFQEWAPAARRSWIPERARKAGVGTTNE